MVVHSCHYSCINCCLLLPYIPTHKSLGLFQDFFPSLFVSLHKIEFGIDSNQVIQASFFLSGI